MWPHNVSNQEERIDNRLHAALSRMHTKGITVQGQLKVLALMETSIVQTTSHVGISSATVVQWYQYFRDIISLY